MIRVIDTGIGIPGDQFEHIFEEFGQVENPLQARVKGTGLGLALSRRARRDAGRHAGGFEHHRCRLTFTLRIPRMHPEVSEYQRLQTREIDPARAPILVVEDDRKTIFIYEKYSRDGRLPGRARAQYRGRGTHHCEDASRRRRARCDARRRASWNFLARLKKDPQTHDIPVLVVTVTAKEEKARALGADEFWIKPVDQARLLRKLGSLVHERNARQSAGHR